MKLACTPISFQNSFKSGDLDLYKFLAFCSSHEVKGVDFLDPDQYPWFWGTVTRPLEGVKIAKAEGVEIAAWACGNNFAKTSASERTAQIDAVCRGIDRAAECGTTRIRIFGGYHENAGGDPGVTNSHGMELVIKSLEAVLPHAEKAGVVLALENHGRLPGHSYQSLAMIRHFDSPWLRATYDSANYIGNTMDEDECPLRACDALAGYIEHVHLKDVWPSRLDKTRRMEPCPAGQGVTPLRQIAARLVEGGYEGYCSLEYEAHKFLPEHEGVPQSLAYLKEAIQCAGFLKLPVAGK